MPMSAAECGLGAFRPVSGALGTDVLAAGGKPLRLRAADPANEAFEARRRAIVCACSRAPLERVATLLVAATPRRFRTR